jgi:hypothetical protein
LKLIGKNVILSHMKRFAFLIPILFFISTPATARTKAVKKSPEPAQQQTPPDPADAKKAQPSDMSVYAGLSSPAKSCLENCKHYDDLCAHDDAFNASDCKDQWRVCEEACLTLDTSQKEEEAASRR